MMTKLLRHRNKSRGQSILEYCALLVFLIAAIIVFQKYIARGIWGRWKTVGDSLAQGRQYDPETTLSCEYDSRFGTGVWYNADCFDENCIEACYKVTGSQDECETCIHGCHVAKCDD